MDTTTAAAFSCITSSLDAPLIVVTVAVDGERAGCLVGFHSQSSIEPRRYSVWLSKANHTYRVATRAAHLGIHLLTADDLPLAERFGTLTGDDTDKFAALDVGDSPDGVPELRVVPNRLVLRRTALLDEGGDHVCVAGEVISAVGTGPFTPLRLAAAAHLRPGHSADDVSPDSSG